MKKILFVFVLMALGFSFCERENNGVVVIKNEWFREAYPHGLQTKVNFTFTEETESYKKGYMCFEGDPRRII